MVAGAILGSPIILDTDKSAELDGYGHNLPGINPGLSTNESGEFVINEWDINELRVAGCKTFRMEMGIRGHGAEGWSEDLLYGYEKIMMEAAANGMQVAIQVGGGTIYGESANEFEDWNRNSIESGGTGRNDYMTKLVNTTAEIVAKKGHRFNRVEVWNEPALRGWTYIEPSIMASLMTDMYIAVKHVNPSMEIVYGGYMATEDPKYLTSVIECGNKYFGWNGALPWDTVGMHMYISDAYDSSFNYWFSRLHKLIGRYDMPIRVTEIGWQSANTEESEKYQAECLRKYYQYVSKHPEHHVIESNWYTYKDTVQGGVPLLYGLCRGDDYKKDSYRAFQEYAAGMAPQPTPTPIA